MGRFRPITTEDKTLALASFGIERIKLAAERRGNPRELLLSRGVLYAVGDGAEHQADFTSLVAQMVDKRFCVRAVLSIAIEGRIAFVSCLK